MTVCQGIFLQLFDVKVMTAIITIRPNRDCARRARVFSVVSSGTMEPIKKTATVTKAASGRWSFFGIIS